MEEKRGMYFQCLSIHHLVGLGNLILPEIPVFSPEFEAALQVTSPSTIGVRLLIRLFY
jgi:hypothetical protein